MNYLQICRYITLCSLMALSAPGQAEIVPHASTAVTTEQTTTSTSYVDISGASISSSSFTTGKSYLVMVSAHVAENDSLAIAAIQTVHGTTAFSVSEKEFGRSSSNKDWDTYAWFTVWTAVSGEGIKLQFKTSAGTMSADQIHLFALQLSDYLTLNTDYFWAERSTNDALSTTPTDGASVAFTPDTAGHNWLVLSYAQFDAANGTDYLISRIVRSGEASSSTPDQRMKALSANYDIVATLGRVFSLGAASNTFREQSESSATSGTRLHSSLLVLNLSKFTASTTAYTDGSTTLSTSPAYTNQIQTASITPTTADDVWIGATFVHDHGTAGGKVEWRVQVDNTDQPATQTSDDWDFETGDAADLTTDIPYMLTTVANLSAAAHTVDLDANATTGANVKYRQIWAVQLNIAPTGTSSRLRPVLLYP